MGLTNPAPDVLGGTPDPVILESLVGAPMHGCGIAQPLKLLAEDVLHIHKVLNSA